MIRGRLAPKKVLEELQFEGWNVPRFRPTCPGGCPICGGFVDSNGRSLWCKCCGLSLSASKFYALQSRGFDAGFAHDREAYWKALGI